MIVSSSIGCLTNECYSLLRVHTSAVAIYDPDLNIHQLASLIRQDISTSGELSIADSKEGWRVGTISGPNQQTITLFQQSSMRNLPIPWRTTGALYVIVTKRGHTDLRFLHLSPDGAERLLLTFSAPHTNVPRFRPGQRYDARARLHAYFAPPQSWPSFLTDKLLASKAQIAPRKARDVMSTLGTISYIVFLKETNATSCATVEMLSHDAVGACYLWHMTIYGRNGTGLEAWHAEFEECLHYFLHENIDTQETRTMFSSAISAAETEKPILFKPREVPKKLQ